jgi:hypothetical protein
MEERIRRLDSINFTWGTKQKVRKNATSETVKFGAVYEHLASFWETYSHTMLNKLEKEWKRGTLLPLQRVFHHLPLFLAFVQKEQLLYPEGRPCSLVEEILRKLTELGVEWRRPASEPRQSTRGEASRKRRRRADVPPDAQLDEHHRVKEQRESRQSEDDLLDGYHYEGIEVDDVEEHRDHHRGISVHSLSGM